MPDKLTDFNVRVTYNGDEWGWSAEMTVPGHEHEDVSFYYGKSPEGILRELGERLKIWRYMFTREDWKDQVPPAYHFLKGML